MSTYITEYFPDPDCIAKYNGAKSKMYWPLWPAVLSVPIPRSLRCTGYIRRVVSMAPRLPLRYESGRTTAGASGRTIRICMGKAVE